MSVKVVQGLIGDVKAKPASPLNQQNLASAQANNSAAASVLQNIATTEAVSVSVRTHRTSSSGEKIREYKEAKQVAEKTAEEIRKDDGSTDAHAGLNTSKGAASLV